MPAHTARESVASYALPRILPFAVFIAFIALDGVLQGLAMQVGMDARWLYGVRIAIVVALMASFCTRYSELATLAPAQPADWALAVLVGVAVFALWVNLDFKPLALGTAQGFDPRSADGAVHWGLAAVRLGGAALVVPLMEELFWRSLVMRWIDKPQFWAADPRQLSVKALLISSALFALEHHLWFAGLLAGVAYGWLYIRTGNLWTAVLAHAVTNALLGAWVLYTGTWQFW